MTTAARFRLILKGTLVPGIVFLSLAAGAALLPSTSAKADFELDLSESSVNGGALVNVVDTTSTFFNYPSSGTFSFGDFSGAVDATIIATSSSSYITFATRNLTNNNTSSTASLELLLGDTGLTGPGANSSFTLILAQSGDGEFANGTLAMTMQSFADPYNGQNTTSGTGVAATGISSESYSGNSETFTLAPPPLVTLNKTQLAYSLTNVVDFTLSPKANVQKYTGTTKTEFPTETIPEPATAALLAVGGLGLLTRRRKIVEHAARPRESRTVESRQ